MKSRNRRTLSTSNHTFWYLLVVQSIFAVTVGCDTMTLRPQSPDPTQVLLDGEEEAGTQYVGDISAPWGLAYGKIESVALVTRLDGTGSAPSPSVLKDRLLNEMRARDVISPEQMLERDDNSLVLVQGFMPPGIRKGERFDLEVKTSKRSRTTSLQDGYVMPTRLRPIEVMGNSLQQGHEVGMGRGPLIVDSIFDSSDKTAKTRGRVLGGGVATKSRKIGLAIASDSSLALEARAVAISINHRFETVENGHRTGVASAKSSNSIELLVPLNYRNHLLHYLMVVANIAFDETEEERIERLDRLERELQEPFLASRAALRLEAIGDEAVTILKRGMQSKDVEIRFYSAEALAYLGVPEAAPVLGEIARIEPAFRWHAFAALSSMTDVEAGLALSELLHERSAETRYGAFRALQARSPDDPTLGYADDISEFYFHAIPSDGVPMIHLARTRRPEIVLFGIDQRVSAETIYVQTGMTIKAIDDHRLQIIRYLSREGDRKVECSSRVEDLIRTVVGLGGDYQTIMEMLRTLSDSGYLESRIAIDALPKQGKNRPRMSDDVAENGAAPDEQSSRFIAGPLPTLFGGEPDETDEEEETHHYEDASDQPSPDGKRSFFGKVTSFWTGD